MDEETAKELLNKFEAVQCPFTSDIDPAYLSDLLLVPSPHRKRLLKWVFTNIDPEIEKMLDTLHSNRSSFNSSLEIDGDIQFLTGVAATLGLCLQADVDLIRGRAIAAKHIAFWQNLLSIATNISRQPGFTHNSACVANNIVEEILRTCDLTAALSTTLKLIPPAIERDVHISLKEINISKPTSFDPVEEKVKKLHSLEKELNNKKEILKNLTKNHSFSEPSSIDPSLFHKLSRSLVLSLGDLDQLQTAYLQTHESYFQPYCDKSPIKFDRLGSTLHSIDHQLTALLQIIENLKQIKASHNEISKSIEK